MLVEDQLVEVKVSSHTFKHYNELGYNAHKGDTIYVPPEHLTPHSNPVVQVQCDICKKIISKIYNNYIRQHTHGLDVCFDCKESKSQITNMEKYGVQYTFCNEDVKDKIRETNLNKYGVKYPTQSDVIKQKTKQTVYDKYGVNNVFQYQQFIEQAKQTNLKNLGCEYSMQSDEIRAKRKQTCLNKYGVPFVSQSLEIKNKIIQTNIEKYGVSCVFLNPDIKQKAINSTKEKYGTECIFSVPEIQEKIRRTMYTNGTVPTSKPQLQLYSMVLQKYQDAILNYPVGSCSLDIFIDINNVKIDIEYDGWYYHQDEHKDFRRDMYMKKRGFKVLRIRSGVLLPTEEELFSAIDYLANTEHHFKEIILSDWKENIEKEGDGDGE